MNRPTRPPSSLARLVSRSATHAVALATGAITLAGAASAETVDPDDLQSTIVEVSGEGLLCPEGSIIASLNLSQTVATVIFSQSLGGVQTAGCKLTFELEVPDGLTLGMPTTILRGVALDRTRFERRYAFEGAGASDAFIEEPPVDFVIQDVAELEARSCGGVRRVRYSVDVTAQVQTDTSFFQLDSVDVDTSFRFGTDYAFCDPGRTLEIAPGESGEFCDGPQARPCAAGLRCDRERDPNSSEGVCAAEE